VKETAIDHSVERLAERGQVQSVGNDKPGSAAPIPRLAVCNLNRPGSGIDPGRLEAETGRHQGVLPGPTTGIENAAA
jgi:hypothetical protein